MPKASKTNLEAALERFKSRRDEILVQIRDAEADVESAREAVIDGAPAVELQTARAKLESLQDVASELERRAQGKEQELQATSDAEFHAQKVVLVKGQVEQWKETELVALEQGRTLVSAVLLMPQLVNQFLSIADQHTALVQLTREHGLESSEVGLNFDRINAASLFVPLSEGLDGRDQSALNQLLQHYLRFAAIGDTSAWNHLSPQSPTITVKDSTEVAV